MYQLTFGNYLLYDPRLTQSGYVIIDSDVHIACDSAGSMSFSLLPDHPAINKLTRMIGRVNLSEDGRTIYRGRIINSTKNFDTTVTFETEGVMACLNDSVIPPYRFPEDFLADEGYQSAAESGNVIEFLFSWLLNKHNEQVTNEQKIYPGTVTVTDPNNYITRSKSDPASTYDVMKDALWGSSLGGYILVRYEDNGTYLDYYSELPLQNAQTVEFGENILDLIDTIESTKTYTAVYPVGADGITIYDLADGEFEGLKKEGFLLVDAEKEKQFGRITNILKFDDVTESVNLRAKAAEWLISYGVGENRTIECNAIDLHVIDGELSPFFVGRATLVNSNPHGTNGSFALLEMDIDLTDPTSTKITLGKTLRTFTGSALDSEDGIKLDIDNIKSDIVENTGIINTEIEKITEAQQNAESIIFSALERKTEQSDFETYKSEQESKLEILSDQIEISVSQTDQKINDAIDGINSITTETGYTFGADGLRIKKSGEEMENILDNVGMRVMRGNTEILTADNTGVNALNLTARQYLIIGTYSRIEDYINEQNEKQTAVFWIGDD